MPTLQDRIAESQLTLRATRTDHNPNLECDDMDHNPNLECDDMDHWRCTIKSGATGKRIQITFSMGSAHNGKEPELAEVLSCMISDAAGWENAGSFEDWCAEYGYDTDSRKAERSYRAVEREVDQLTHLVGSRYHALLWETEQL